MNRRDWCKMLLGAACAGVARVFPGPAAPTLPTFYTDRFKQDPQTTLRFTPPSPTWKDLYGEEVLASRVEQERKLCERMAEALKIIPTPRDGARMFIDPIENVQARVRARQKPADWRKTL